MQTWTNCKWLFSAPGVVTLSVPSLLFCFGLFMTYPLTGLIFVDIICNKDGDEHLDDDCSSTDISKKASQVLFLGSLAGDLPALLFLGIYSTIADKFGRRMSMLLPSIGALIYFGGLFLIALLKPASYLWIYVAVSFVYGCCGSYSTFLMGMFSYLADITLPNERSSKYSILEAMIFICQIVGPLGGGFWAFYSGFVPPMFCAVLSVFAAIVWVYFMPESLPIDAPSRQLTPSSGISVVPFILLGFAFFFWAQMSSAIVFPLFAKHVFHWDSDFVGIALSLQGLLVTLSMISSRKLFSLISSYQLHPILWIVGGIFGWSVFYFIFSFAWDTSSAIGTIFLCIICGQALPLIRSTLANCVPNYMQARMAMSFGALQSTVTLLSTVATMIYSASLDFDPSVIYWVLSASCFVGFLLLLCTVVHPDIRCNLPDLSGSLPSDRMGFASTDPLIHSNLESQSGDRFKDKLRIASTTDVLISSAITTLADDIEYASESREEDGNNVDTKILSNDSQVYSPVNRSDSSEDILQTATLDHSSRRFVDKKMAFSDGTKRVVQLYHKVRTHK